MEISREWCIRMAQLEADAEIGAGRLANDPVFNEEAAPVVASDEEGLNIAFGRFVRLMHCRCGISLEKLADDDELLLLNAYGQSYGAPRSNAWDAIGRPPSAHFGSSTEDIDNAKLYEFGEQNLLRLGLLQPKFDNMKKGEYPPFGARSGGFKSRTEISYLGRMLLREVGIDLPF
ncbi:MAG: hypothetical protein OXB94_06115 [Nitrospira sp.]|nr:hypothetical protein [Nitrospira sp.]